MNQDTVRNLRLAGAATLLSIWGMAHLASIPVLGDSIVVLLLALLVSPGSPFSHWRANRAGVLALAAALVALTAITALLARLGSAPELIAFSHSPWFVLPLWALALFGLVRNATASARGASAAADAAPGNAGGSEQVADASGIPAPAVPSRRR